MFLLRRAVMVGNPAKIGCVRHAAVAACGCRYRAEVGARPAGRRNLAVRSACQEALRPAVPLPNRPAGSRQSFLAGPGRHRLPAAARRALSGQPGPGMSSTPALLAVPLAPEPALRVPDRIPFAGPPSACSRTKPGTQPVSTAALPARISLRVWTSEASLHLHPKDASCIRDVTKLTGRGISRHRLLGPEPRSEWARSVCACGE